MVSTGIYVRGMGVIGKGKGRYKVAGHTGGTQTMGPNRLCRSCMVIHPSRNPGTRNLLVNPRQDRTGTSWVREAMGMKE